MRTWEDKPWLLRWWKPLIIVAVVAVIFFLPMVMGILIQQKMLQTFQLMTANDPYLKLISYKRGFFYSDIELLVKDDKNELTVQIEIDHGPYLFLYNENITDMPFLGLARADYSIVASSKTSEALAPYFGQQDLLTGELTVGFNGIIKSIYKSAAMHYYNQESNFIINWPGLSGEMHINSQAQQITNIVSIGNLSITDSFNNVAVDSSTLSTTSQLNLEGIPFYNMVLDVGNVTISAKNEPFFKGDGLTFQFETLAIDNLIQYQDKLAVKDLYINNQNYAPSYTATTIKQIDVQSYKQLLHWFNSPAATTQNLSFIQQCQVLLLMLIQQGAKFNKYFEITTPNGKATAMLDLYSVPKNASIRGTLKMVMPREVLESVLVIALSNHSDIIQRFKQQHSDVMAGKLPEQQMQSFIASEATQGYFIVDGNNYIMDFTLQDGEVRLNGKPVDMSFLTGAITVTQEALVY